MIRLRNRYRKEVPLATEKILSLIYNSKDFIKEESPGYGGQHYTSSIINKIIYNNLSNNTIQLSENAGLSGFLELIGDLTIHKINNSKSEISIKFQMGAFPLITPYVLTAFLGLIGILLLFIEIALSIFPFGLMFISLIFMYAKQYRVGFFLKKIEQALDIDNQWSS
ncbi:MAG: hypothetical protein ACM3P1_00510 [Candidatus Saccharibacteria bacterium]